MLQIYQADLATIGVDAALKPLASAAFNAARPRAFEAPAQMTKVTVCDFRVGEKDKDHELNNFAILVQVYFCSWRGATPIE